MGRVEAFSDGVIAIILTIMVLDLKVPQQATVPALLAIWPTLLAYALSFLVVAIMWVNHHHVLRTAKRPDAALLWSNNLLLFCMSLIPFVTRYLGDSHGAPLAVAVYAADLALCSVGFFWLHSVLCQHNLGNEVLERQYRRIQAKAGLSVVLYSLAAPLAFLSVRLAIGILVLIPLAYFLPDRELLEV